MSLLIGSRGLGALIGPLCSAKWVGHRQDRLRLGILVGFLAVGLGYGLLGVSGSLWMACFWVIVAHSGGSMVWVFVTTLLQLNTDDKFRGRVFSAELGLSMIVLAVTGYLTGILIDRGVDPRTVAVGTGLLMILPAGLWAWAMRTWRAEPVSANV
jgi:hypothetical protein